MAQLISTKRVAISKANAQMVIIVAVAAFVTIFCLVASKAVWSQNAYQSRVTSAKETAHHHLQDNLKAFDSLVTSYKTFDGASKNVIGGSNSGTADKDGSNSKIALDSLPSSYDFPALASSLEKILADQHIKVGGITGTDDQLNQQANVISPTPQPVPIPFSFTVTDANYTAVQQLISTLEHSIRPIQIDSLSLSGNNSNLSVTVNAHTYYQPGKSVSIVKKVIK
ncbi:hypothetical protein COY17_01160 [Candidatus Saccharibacteria bacterium CG_4_10_14_0_2_um_filter_52_9]|nr:MAG: hypothetical protein COY17_01160 [Candidatus Saccharibacteria bacterium CG_4_10_14_0_2_um_filter_52_9]